ncbi:MAG: error-prone polymerase [Nocardioidaceae bacterium]|jgi:error-prone DNA polymerase|nr:error-prone polymerase [Nocardioidaceae bacterium]
MDPFVHLHVASGYSLRYGASHPRQLAERAAEAEMDALALTDRDGVYGAVRFAKACQAVGIRPILGVDLAVEPSGIVATSPAAGRRTPVRGGQYIDHDQVNPRVTLLAGSKAGWAALCRLVSATHLRGERGVPVTTRDLVADHLAGLSSSAAGSGHDLLVMLGARSELGWAAALRRDDLARAVLRDWYDVTDRTNLLVEVMSHRREGAGPGSSPHAARMAGVAAAAGCQLVLSNDVRYADRADAPVVDVLDAARRLVPLDLRHVDRANAEGFLKTGKEMADIADEICRFAGLGEADAERLLAGTRAVADRCALDPRADLGLGEVHFPELDVAGLTGGGAGTSADAVLRARCEAGVGRRYGSGADLAAVHTRLHDELTVIGSLGYATYFLTVADVVDLVRDMGVRVAARGSGAGSLVNYLLGVSGVDPMRYGLLMERFLSPLRQALPDIDVDVESARRLEVYERILERYTGTRCACVSMMDTYRVRHAVRDVGAALGLPPGEIDQIAKAFPHIRARDARTAVRELPELRSMGLESTGLGDGRLDLLFRLVEKLDGLPRHIAVHPCGVLLSDATLLDRTPVEASFLGYPMSQFDKDDVEDLGLLKLDVLGIRMQSAMAHAVAEVARVDGIGIDIDDESQVPRDDPTTYALIQSTKTLGCFQIESPGQRELVGKFPLERFEDIIIDISLFRPGPVKSDMIVPFLRVRHGWSVAEYLHPDLRRVLEQTHGVVVFHEQVIEMIAIFAGCSLAEADEARRALGDREGQADVKTWFFPRALGCGYPLDIVRQVWAVLEAFASFGFCKAHAAAFALPTFQSAWLKAHHPAAFLAGVLTHDPGMYPKRLILDDARHFGIAVLPLDVNVSDDVYRVERLDTTTYGIRLALAEVKGISAAEVARIVAARPFHSLTDLWQRARVSRPVVERLVLTGAFDALYGIGSAVPVRRRGTVTRRDLLLQVAELDRWTRATDRAVRAVSSRSAPARQVKPLPAGQGSGNVTGWADSGGGAEDPRLLAAAQSQGPLPVQPVTAVQLTLDLDDVPALAEPSGLPEMSGAERVRAELEVLGLDVSHHAVDFYAPMLRELEITWSRDLLKRRNRSELLVAGVKVATQTPPIRSGRRVIFLTLDDGTGPVDATFFEDVQGPYAATVFHSWLLVVRGELRRTGPRGVSLRATGCWELPDLYAGWQRAGMAGVREILDVVPVGFDAPQPQRVLVHPSGFRQSPYADLKPAGIDTKTAPRKLWHSSPGSAGG